LTILHKKQNKALKQGLLQKTGIAVDEDLKVTFLSGILLLESK
jgi:hypothetical protein